MTTDVSNTFTSLQATPAAPVAEFPAPLPGDLAACHALIRELLEAQRDKDHLIAGMQHQLDQLLRRVFGRSAEKIDPNQLALFEKMLAELAPSAPTAPAPVPSAPATAASQPNGHGRRRLPAELERRPVIFDVPEAEKPCPCCGTLRVHIGDEISEKLDFQPAKLFVRQEIRRKYVCQACTAAAAETGPQIVAAEKPLSPIEKGLAAPGLLAYVIVSKYSDHLPLHRLERILERHDIQIRRSTTCDWMAACAEALRPLYNLMVREVLQSRVLHTDDTPVDVLDREVPGTTKTGRFWVYAGDEDHRQTVEAAAPGCNHLTREIRVVDGLDRVDLINTIDKKVPVKLVTATRGKAVRAEPISSIYEKGRAHHFGEFPNQTSVGRCNGSSLGCRHVKRRPND